MEKYQLTDSSCDVTEPFENKFLRENDGFSAYSKEADIALRNHPEFDLLVFHNADQSAFGHAGSHRYERVNSLLMEIETHVSPTWHGTTDTTWWDWGRR